MILMNLIIIFRVITQFRTKDRRLKGFVKKTPLRAWTHYKHGCCNIVLLCMVITISVLCCLTSLTLWILLPQGLWWVVVVPVQDVFVCQHHNVTLPVSILRKHSILNQFNYKDGKKSQYEHTIEVEKYMLNLQWNAANEIYINFNKLYKYNVNKE